MHGLTTSWGIAARRIFSYKGVSLAVAAGVLVAAVVLAFIPAYERAMADLGVQFNISNRSGDESRSTVFSAVQLGNGLPQQESRAIIETSRSLGWFLTYEATGIRSVIFKGQPVREDFVGAVPDVFLGSVSGLEQRVTVLEGAFPEPGELAIVLGADPAERLGMSVGDEIAVDMTISNCFPPPPGGGGLTPGPPPPPCDPSVLLAQSLTFRLAAIVEPIDPADSFWTNVLFRVDRVELADMTAFIPLTVPYETMRTTVAELAPGLPVGAAFVFKGDIDAVTSANEGEVRARFTQLGDTLRQSDMLLSSQIDDSLREFAAQSDFSAAPIRLLALQAALVVIFYVLIVGALLSDQLLPETVLLRARGASLFSIMALAFFQGLTFAIPGAIAAPFIASGVVALLGYTPAFDLPIVEGTLPFALTPAAFLYSALGALAATLAATIPTVLSARMSPSEERRRLSRADLAPFFQRYYLDVGALAVAAALIFELTQEDAVFNENAFGGLSADPLLLLAPSIFGLAAVAILLRVLPIVLRVAARVLRPAAGATSDLALVSLSRASGRYARLVALLVLVFALGAFAATFAPTLERSFEERTLYDVGPEIRADGLALVRAGDIDNLAQPIEEVEGVDRAMSVWRGTGTIGLSMAAPAMFSVLAVDPLLYPSFVEWRDDFSDPSDPSELLGPLASPPDPPGIELPGTPEAIAVDILAPGRANTNLWARILDGRGRAHLIDMGKLGESGWSEVEIAFRQTFTLRGEIVYPLRLEAFHFTEPTGFFAIAADPILLDNVRVIDDGAAVLVESFEGVQAWSRFSVVPGTADLLNIIESVEARDGDRVLEFDTVVGRSPRKRGIYPASPLFPVSAIASETFLGAHGLGPGSVFELTLGSQVVPVRIVDVAALAPTLSPDGRGFLIVDRTALFAWSQTANEDPTRPTEVWVSLEPGADPAVVATALADVIGLDSMVIRAQRVEVATTNPTLSAGAAGLLWFGFIAAFLVLCLAVILSLALDAVQRRVQFAVVRAMGFRGRSVYVVLAFEYTVIVAIGAIAGVILGLQVSETMTGFLGFTENGDPVRPPFLIETDWATIALAAAAFAGFVALGVFLAGAYLARASIARSIRLDA